MINWRKPIIISALKISGQPVFSYLKLLTSAEYSSPEDLLELQHDRLEKLLRHAYKKVPYYHKVLAQAGVVKDGKLCLTRFGEVPVLTKQLIRTQGTAMYAADYKSRKAFRNTTGGATGEPLEFLQDRDYRAWSFARRFYFNLMAGKDIGQPEIKLWGSQQDTLVGAERLSTRLKRWGFNMLVLNSFLMTDEKMKEYAEKWNAFRPKQVWAYTSSIYEFGRYLRRKNMTIFSPCSIICAAETLTEQVRTFVEEVFGCHALNQYGSREAGAMACECPNKEGLHTFVLDNKIEILDEHLRPCQPGETGNIYVTTLNNYSMPLIRYRIGDMGTVAKHTRCSCGRGWPLIANIVGRHIEAFRTKDGRAIPGQFFIHFVGVVYNEGYIKRFQVIQKDYDKILVRVVVADEAKFSSRKQDIVESIRKVLGQKCKVEFEYVDDIPPTKSGKYLYTISELKS